MGLGPERHGELPDIVAIELAGLDPLAKGVGYNVESGRAAGAEVVGEAAGAGPGSGENVVENAGMGKGVVHVAVHDMDDTCDGCAPFHRFAEELGEAHKFGIDDLVEQDFAAGKVVIDRHRRDAGFPRNAAHAYGLGRSASRMASAHR